VKEMKREKKDQEIKIEKETVEKIKKLQSLPEEIVIRFLKSKSSLAATDFENKFISDAE
jgi:hypothetical protein